MASESNTVVVAALIGNILVAITKTIAAVMTGSSAYALRGDSQFCRYRQ